LKNKVIDIFCLCLVGAIFGSITFLNVFQPNRPTESVAEKRKLTEMPQFTLESLFDGSYFSQMALHFSDTFIYRDSLVLLSRDMDILKGVDYSLGDDNNFVVIGGPQTDSTPKQEESDINILDDKLNEAFDNLNNKESGSETEIDPDFIDDPSETKPIETDPIETTDPSIESDSDDIPNVEEPEKMQTILENGDIKEYLGAIAKDDPSITVNNLKISKTNLSLTIGSGASIYAVVDPVDSLVSVIWSVSDPSVASISGNSRGVNIKALADGTCTLKCSYNEKVFAECTIKVTTISGSGNTGSAGSDFLPNGMFIYGDGVYTQAYYSPVNSSTYAKTAAYYKQLFGEKTRVSVVIAPVSSMVVNNKEVQSKIANQGEILNKMRDLMDPSVNFVDTYTEMSAHVNEYLFYKSDHHWTARGAYYAYSAFAKSLGFTPTPLEGFDFEIKNDKYYGSYYTYTNDARVKNFFDTIEVFKSRKPHTMTAVTPQGQTLNFDNCIVSYNKTYVTFIAGDNPYTVINVPDNPQNMNVLVLKDSFGNAFVPYLCEHYGNIIVIDTRHSDVNVYEQFKDYGLTDIIFVNNIQAANSAAWAAMYLNAVGVTVN